MKSKRKAKDEIHDSIKELLGCVNMSEVLRLAEDRSVWRSVADNVNLDSGHGTSVR